MGMLSTIFNKMALNPTEGAKVRMIIFRVRSLRAKAIIVLIMTNCSAEDKSGDDVAKIVLQGRDSKTCKR